MQCILRTEIKHFSTLYELLQFRKKYLRYKGDGS